MAYKIMIQGTMSSAGKSFIVTGLCRLFCDLGYKVAPFKSQNMALNSGVTEDGLEMGRAQIVQAEAARTKADVRMNPILLKPNSDIGSQVIVMGKPVGNMKAKEYYQYKKSLIPVIKEAFYSLENDYDIIVVEGAGSPAEINLKENDIVNMGLAKMLDIPVLLVGDIDLGGVFAQLLGTLEWLEEDEKNLIRGLLINKFRGDVSLLKPGIDMMEKRSRKKILGVIPFSDVKIDEEDSVTLQNFSASNISLAGNKSDFDENELINICIISLPHLSNFTDFTPLKLVDGVRVSFVKEIPDNTPDIIIIPGTKNTIGDLAWMREKHLDEYIINNKDYVPVMGICGGNQILGNSIRDKDLVEGEDFIYGLSLLDQDTELFSEKILTNTSGIITCPDGFFSCLNNVYYEGYEIHSGLTNEAGHDGDVFGTYVHGIFDKAAVTKALIYGLLDRRKKDINCRLNEEYFGKMEKSIEAIADYDTVKDREYDKLARSLDEAIDIGTLFRIMGIN